VKILIFIELCYGILCHISNETKMSFSQMFSVSLVSIYTAVFGVIAVNNPVISLVVLAGARKVTKMLSGNGKEYYKIDESYSDKNRNTV